MSQVKDKPEFKPSFTGYMKLYLHDEYPELLRYRASFEGEWSTQKKRWQIFKKPRRFSVRLHIVDESGNKCGHTVFDFKGKGGMEDLSRNIFEQARDFMLELIDDGYEVDPTDSYAIVRV